MKIALVIAMLGATAAGSAAAAEKITDLDYIRANRCKGLAVGLGVTDTKDLDDYLKAARVGRFQMAEARASQEFDRARHDARRGGKERFAAELNGACAVYRGSDQATATTTGAKGAAPAS